MPVEILYLWLLALPVFGAVLYVRHRVRQGRLKGEPIQLFPQRERMQGWLTAVVQRLQTVPAEPSPLPDDEVEVPTALPDMSDEIIDGSLSTAQMRLPVSVMIAAGLLLVFMGQAAYRQVPDVSRWAVFGLMAIGLLLFLLGGRIAVRRRVPVWLIRIGRRFARFLGIRSGQVALLGLSLCFVLMATITAGAELVAHHALVATLSWLIAIGFAVVGTWTFDARKVQIEWRDVLVTAVLFFFAFLLRGINMEGIPTTLSGDEGSAGMTSVMFLKGQINNLFSFGWFSFPSFYFAVQSLGIWLWGNTAAALRLTSALAGALTVVATYWLGRTMFDRPTGALAGAYLAASHYHIHISRIGLNNVWDGLFATIAIAGLWHGWQSGRRAGFITSGLALGFGQYFYVSIRILPVIFTIWSGIAYLWQRLLFRRRLPGLLVTAFIAFIVFFPLGLLYARFPDNFNAPMQRVTIFNGWLQAEEFRTGLSTVPIILDQMQKAAAGFTHTPLRLLYDPGVPLLLTGAATLFLIGVVWGILHFDLRYLLLLMPLVSAVITSGFSLDPPASQRYIMSIPLVAVLIALPLGQAVKWLRQLWPERRRIVLTVAALIMIVIMFVDLRYYFFDVYDNYVLGGWNTETATEIAYYLRDHEIQKQKVYFFGAPRMGYYSLSTIPYLAPEMQGEDVVEPLTKAPEWQLDGPTLFVFLPEREHELEHVRRTFPNGRVQKNVHDRGQQIFIVYEVSP